MRTRGTRRQAVAEGRCTDPWTWAACSRAGTTADECMRVARDRELLRCGPWGDPFCVTLGGREEKGGARRAPAAAA